MFTKELAVPLILFTMSIALKTCSLVMLCSMHNTESAKNASSDDVHDIECESGVIMASAKNKKAIRNSI